MANYPNIETALYSRLATDASIAALVGGTASPRIYSHQAPSGAARPFVLFYEATSTLTNETPRLDINHIYRIEANAATRAAAESLKGAIFTALHEVELTGITGYSNFRLVCERHTALIENISGGQVYRRIGDYRIQLSKEG